jgi:signal transduction histidine kinase
MEEGGKVMIKTERLTRAGKMWVCLTIEDTGSGISPANLSKIFDPFFTTKPVGKGTGLGLSLVHEIVNKHGGVIDVQSHPGLTQFLIQFPGV